jgi:hypothetical protein
MHDSHQTQPDVDLEFDLMWATIWDSIWTEIFLREDASEVPPEEARLRDEALKARKLKAAEDVVLVDGEFRHATHDTFWMPDLDDRENLPTGESVQLIFTDGHASERLWVEVVARAEDGSYLGLLMNTPVYLPLDAGCSVHFEAKHVIQIHCEVECHG